jgi:hypothetical protein
MVPHVLVTSFFLSSFFFFSFSIFSFFCILLFSIARPCAAFLSSSFFFFFLSFLSYAARASAEGLGIPMIAMRLAGAEGGMVALQRDKRRKAPPCTSRDAYIFCFAPLSNGMV